MSDYKTIFNEKVSEFCAEVRSGKHADRDARKISVSAMIDWYVAHAGKAPDSGVLDRLSDAILHEDLVDTHPDKITRDEYPVMSQRQLDRRHATETSEKQSEEYDANGKNRGVPVKRRRSNYENGLVDKFARSRNKERRAKYREFTKTQPVIKKSVADI